MCVFEACPDPTTPGVWWRDDAAWHLYDAANQRRIRNALSHSLNSIDLGVICSSVHPSGARYVAHLNSMQQVNVSSGQQRDIKIIDQVSGARITLPIARNNIAQPSLNRTIAVHYRDESGVLTQYESQIGNALLSALFRNQTNFEYNCPREGGHENLRFDLVNMKQICSDGKQLDVILEILWNPVTLSTIASSKTCRRKVICDVIDCKVRCENVLNCLKPKLHPRKVNRTHYNPFLCSGNRVYDSFVEIMEISIFGKGEDVDKPVLPIASMLNAEESSNGLLKMVFSADTPEKNDLAIFENGVDVQPSSLSCFSLETMASAYTQINMQLKFLVFLVILDAAAATQRAHQIFVSKSEQLLPVARIDVSELWV